MENLELPSLRDILAGSVGFYNNYNLCYIRTINWSEILTGPSAKPVYVYNFTQPERKCKFILLCLFGICVLSCLQSMCIGVNDQSS